MSLPQTSLAFRLSTAVAVVALAWLLRMALVPWLGDQLVYITFFPAVVVAAVIGGFRAGLLAVLLSAFAALYWIPPFGAFWVERPADWLGVGVFIANGILISWVCERMRQSTLAAAAAATAQSEAEKSQRVISSRLAALADQSMAGITATDLDGRFTLVNPRFCQLVGYSAEELLSLHRHDITHPDDMPHSRELFHRLAENGAAFTVDKRYIRKDGGIVWVSVTASPMRDADGRPQGAVGIVIDISDRIKAQEAIQLQARVLESMSEGVSVSDENGVIVYTNPAEDEMFGYEKGELIGKHVSIQNLYPPDENARIVADVIAVLKDKGVWTGEWKNRRKNGSPFISYAHITSLEAGGKRFWVCVQRDVTEQKRAAAEREQLLNSERAARTEAERSNRVKDEFLATLSHELRTPLNAILGWSQLLKRTEVGSRELAEGLAVIERNTRIQTHLIEDLLDMSRIITGKVRLDVQQVDLPAVIEAAISSIQPAADAKGIRIQRVLDPLAGPVSGDPNRLQQVVWNLLSNAVKFTPKEGRIQVILARVNSHVEIRVTDNGQGIKPEFLPHVFDRFRQADATTTRRQGGLGLGLSIVKHLAELHGGSVRVQSDGDGLGATFTVELPLTPVASEPGEDRHHPRTPSAAPFDGQAADLRGVNVLVVEDEPDAREIIRHVLEGCDATVNAVPSAAAGLDAIRLHTPDVLISDIGLPDQDGYELIRQVRALDLDHAARVPAVALTAFARSEDRTRAMIAGFDVHVSKPVEPAELVAVIARLAGRSR